MWNCRDGHRMDDTQHSNVFPPLTIDQIRDLVTADDQSRMGPFCDCGAVAALGQQTEIGH